MSQRVSELTGKRSLNKKQRTNEQTAEQTNRRTDGQANKHAKRTVKMNEWGC